jgi:hypothetical protein
MHCLGSQGALSKSNQSSFNRSDSILSTFTTALLLTAKRHAAITLHMHSESLREAPRGEDTTFAAQNLDHARGTI